MADSTVEEDGGGNFTDLSTALADAGTENGNTITIQGAWDDADTTTCTVSDNDITIVTDSSSKHIGRPHGGSETTYRLVPTSGHAITVNGTGLTVDGLDIKNASTGTSDEVFRHAPGATSTVTIKNSVLGFASRNSEQDVFYHDQNNDTIINLENCHFYSAQRAVVDLATPSATITVNVNSCSTYDIGASNVPRDGLVGCSGVGGQTYYVNVFNTIVDLRAGSPMTCTATGTFVISVDRSITNVTTWALNADTFNDGDNTESATIADTTGASAVIFNDISTIPYDLRLQDHANNIAKDLHSDSAMDDPVNGQSLSIPSTDLVGTSRVAAYEGGAYTIPAAGGGGEVIKDIIGMGIIPSPR